MTRREQILGDTIEEIKKGLYEWNIDKNRKDPIRIIDATYATITGALRDIEALKEPNES